MRNRVSRRHRRRNVALRPPIAFTPSRAQFQDESIFISGVRLSTEGSNYTPLDYQDPNQPMQVTGYNVRRSSNAALPKSSWPLLATNVVDMDAATPNRQWVDTTGTAPPQGQVWYYEVTAVNVSCGAEGPF